MPSGLDVAIHCAATVAFDPPIDEGFQTNLIGAMHLYEGVLASNTAPHLVHVSTAYVAGVRKGVIPETTLDHRVDWRVEADLALRARDDVEAASRKPEILDSFLRKARAEHGRAGPAVRRRRRRGASQDVGDQAPRAVRAGACADARVAGQLHVHEGDG